MAVEKEYPGHPDLTGGGVTNLHSHIDGNGGANIKSGEVTGAASTETQVDFATPFPSAPRVVIISRISNWNAWLTTVTASYFKFQNNGSSSSRPFHWIATNAGNP